MQTLRKNKSKSKSRRISLKTVLIFLGIMILAYLPASSFLFFIKNDAFNGYFPAKFYISEAIHNKSFPWWNPYINFGIPQYGDMNSGFWSPITWLVASLFSYNAYTFTIEILFYLFISGVGMFQLSRSFGFTRTVSYISGVAFMCSGYMVGHLQHFNWISAAAFLPWCLWAYHQLIYKYSLKNLVLSAVIFYLFLSSAHPGLIIGFCYFILAYIIFNFFKKKTNDELKFSAASFFKKHLWMFGLLFIFCLGMIVGYSDIIPHFTRGKKIESLALITNPFTLQSIFSLFLPMATVKGNPFFVTDVSMRNIYFGLTLLVFFIFGINKEKSSEQKFFLYTGLFFLILSLGSIFKYITYPLLPMVSYVRLPGEFMIFTLLSLIIFSSFSLNKFLKEKENFTSLHSKPFLIVQLLLVLSVITGVGGVVFTHKSILFHFSQLFSNASIPSFIKSFIDQISFFDILIFQGLLQLIFLAAIKKCFVQKRFKDLISISVLELIMATLLNLPFTGVGMTSVKEINSALEKSPEGLPAPLFTPVINHPTKSIDKNSVILGNWSFYNKQIGTVSFASYPVELTTTKSIFKDSISRFASKPFIFSTNDTAIKNIKVNYFKGNFVDLTVECTVTDTLVYQQNIYPYWKCVVNGESRKPIVYDGVFNAVLLSPGINYVLFTFNPGLVITAMNISKWIFILALFYLFALLFKRPSP